MQRSDRSQEAASRKQTNKQTKQLSGAADANCQVCRQQRRERELARCARLDSRSERRLNPPETVQAAISAGGFARGILYFWTLEFLNPRIWPKLDIRAAVGPLRRGHQDLFAASLSPSDTL